VFVRFLTSAVRAVVKSGFDVDNVINHLFSPLGTIAESYAYPGGSRTRSRQSFDHRVPQFFRVSLAICFTIVVLGCFASQAPNRDSCFVRFIGVVLTIIRTSEPGESISSQWPVGYYPTRMSYNDNPLELNCCAV
jgi:hypothetical protein